MLLNLIFGLYSVMYCGFTVYTIYMVLIGKRIPEQNTLGRFIYWHGQGWIIIFVATAIVTMSFIFASVILKSIGMITFTSAISESTKMITLVGN